MFIFILSALKVILNKRKLSQKKCYLDKVFDSNWIDAKLLLVISRAIKKRLITH